MSVDIARIRGTRKTYLRSISNQENHILDIISNYSANQQNELNLKAKKNSLIKIIEKVKEPQSCCLTTSEMNRDY